MPTSLTAPDWARNRPARLTRRSLASPGRREPSELRVSQKQYECRGVPRADDCEVTTIKGGHLCDAQAFSHGYDGGVHSTKREAGVGLHQEAHALEIAVCEIDQGQPRPEGLRSTAVSARIVRVPYRTSPARKPTVGRWSSTEAGRSLTCTRGAGPRRAAMAVAGFGTAFLVASPARPRTVSRPPSNAPVRLCRVTS